MTRWRWRLILCGMLALLIGAGLAARGVWIAGVARSLVCVRDVAPSDVMLIENFDPYYLLFERAAALQKAGIVSRAVVPVQVSSDPLIPNAIEQGIAELMARQARMGSWETIPIREAEPITLNAATQIRDYLGRSAVNSVVVVSPGFRSRRSMLVYRAVLGEAGMQVRCDPVFG